MERIKKKKPVYRETPGFETEVFFRLRNVWVSNTWHQLLMIPITDRVRPILGNAPIFKNIDVDGEYKLYANGRELYIDDAGRLMMTGFSQPLVFIGKGKKDV